MRATITIRPHSPYCRYALGVLGHWDARMCCYCAALTRQDYAQSGLYLGLSAATPGEDPLEYRYGGPRCSCANGTVR